MEKDDILFILEQTVKAPSGHNTQPWLFRIEENRIRICPDLNKCLPVVDSGNRELFISMGCAAENLFWAAMKCGYHTVFDIQEEGEISVILSSEEESDRSDIDLFNQISIRQTNRRIYSGSKVPASVIRELESIVVNEEADIYLYSNGSEQFHLLENYIIRGNSQQLQDRLFKNELKQWMRYNRRHDQRTKDGLSYSVFGAPNLPRFISESIMSICLNPNIQNRSDRKKIESSSHFALFTIPEDDVAHQIVLGRILQRFLLSTARLGIACAFMNQPCEITGLSGQLRQKLNLSGHPAILLRIGYASSVPYSLRRSVEEFIVG